MGPIIDIHTHAWVDSFAPRVMRAYHQMGLDGSFDGTLDGLVASMDEAGIAASVVLAVPTKPSQVPLYNGPMQAYLGSRRIIPFAGVHPAEDDPVGTIRKAAAAGYKGVKLHPLCQEFAPQERRMWPIYQAIMEEDMVMLFHTGMAAKGYPAKTGNARDFDEFFEHFNDYDKIVLAHLSGQYDGDQLPTPNPQWPCMFDLSYTVNEIPDEVIFELCERIGFGRILFGSDAPWHSQKVDRNRICSLPIAPADLERVMSGNALALLGLDASQVGPEPTEAAGAR